MRRIFGIDLRTLALFRIALGVTILWDLINRAQYLPFFYTDRGVMTRAQAIDWLAPERLSFHLMSGQVWVQAALLLIAGGIAVALIAGWRTRLMTVLSWVFLLSLQNRNPILLQGGDTLLLILLFWSIFLPLGARFSVNAALDSSQHDRRAGDTGYFSAATAAILLQASYVYFFGALLKTSPEWLPDGTAVYYALHLDSLATTAGIWFRQFEAVLHGLTYYVWFLELLTPLLLFSPVLHLPLRLTGQALLITMHIGFALFLFIGLFPVISICSLLLFTPGAVWDWLARRLDTEERTGLAIYYDGDCTFCYKVCLILRTFCLPAETPILRAQDDPEIRPLFEAEESWVVRNFDDRLVTKWSAVNLVLRRSPIFWPIGRLLDLGPLLALCDRLYRVIGNNRMALGGITARALPVRELRLQASRPATALVAALTLTVFYWNVLTLPKVSYEAPDVLAKVFHTVRLAQTWNMFAPHPARSDGWYVVPGALDDGTEVELFTDRRGRVSFDKPGHVVSYYGDYRMRKYFSRLPQDRYKSQLLNYARHLCRKWNRYGHGGERQLIRFQIYYMRETTQLGYAPDTLVRLHLANWRCFPDK